MLASYLNTDISNMIKTLHKSRNLTQEQLRVLSGLTKSQISRKKKETLGSPETVKRLLEAMGYSPELKVIDKSICSLDNWNGLKITVLPSPSLTEFEKYVNLRDWSYINNH